MAIVRDVVLEMVALDGVARGHRGHPDPVRRIRASGPIPTQMVAADGIAVAIP